MPAAVYDRLDGSFAALVIERGDAFAPVLQRSGDTTTLPLFVDASAAHDRLAALPATADAGQPSVRVLDADDPRAKEELLRAAAALGADDVRFDVRGERGDAVADPAVRVEIRLALGHLEAHRRNSACL